MPEREKRHLLGPLLLIFAGIVLLLHQTGTWTFSWSHIARLWPLIFVLLGLDLVLSRTRLGSAIFIIVATGILLAVLVYSPSTPVARPTQSESLTYPAAGLESAEIHLDLGVGRVDVTAMANGDDLYQAHYSHDPDHAQVTADVERDGTRAIARLRAEQSYWAPIWLPWSGFGADAWDVSLNPDVPTHLTITGGVNETNLDLSSLSLTRLDLAVGIGQTHVRLPAQGPYRVLISGGIGALTVELPEGVPARIRADSRLGSVSVAGRLTQDGRYYYTPDYAPGAPAAEIDIDGGIGSITVR
jgi:hypothetical protein